jgi:signal transduction histidine kinase
VPRRLNVDSLGVRITAIFLIGAAALQCVLLLVLFWPGGPGRPMFSLPSPRDAAAMAEVLEAAPADLQPALVRALNTDTVRVHLEPDFPSPSGSDGRVREAPRLQRLFSRYAQALGSRPFQVQTRYGGQVQSMEGGRVGAAGPVRLALRLRTGQVLIVERTMPPAIQRFESRGAIIVAGFLAVLMLVLFAALRQTARPVAELARGARRFAQDLATPDLPVRGALEVKDLAAAFNEMKGTIRTLMDDRTRVLAAIAHDLRTYLTRLRLRAEFIDDPDQRERAAADLDEMSLLLDDTLTFAREATGAAGQARSVVDVAAQIRLLADMRRDMGQAVEVADSAEAGPVAAWCAALALRRMLDNLVDNAVRYAGMARLAARRESGEVVVTVEDDGPGVPADALARLTAPFERVEGSRGRKTGGAGLGLAIVKALAESQGGRLSIENRVEGGLRVILRLPTAPSA